MADKLSGQVAVVTGSARGIGKQIALTFAKNGADIVINDILDMATAANEVKNLGRKVITVKADVTQKGDVKRLFDTAISSFGKVDILVNNAGVTRHAKLLELTEDDWDLVLAVNLKAFFLCTQAVAPHMIKQKYGRIINLTSASPLTNRTHGGANYQCSKAGANQLTRVAARELGPHGINANAIAPTHLLTDMTFTRRSPEESERFSAEIVKDTPLGRLATVQEIANVALFLASEESSFITGQVIVPDGGWS
ncbi:MAG: glucose 1-dehydrogenase [Chloroflexi bacterium]|nr:glucose 1-dehydrogenase [Chloroflexota bacterium]